METIVNYINSNLIWFVIGGVVAIMAIIGYIAEKTDFGRKEKEPKKEKVKKQPLEEVKVAPEVVEAPAVEMPTATEEEAVEVTDQPNLSEASDEFATEKLEEEPILEELEVQPQEEPTTLNSSILDEEVPMVEEVEGIDDSVIDMPEEQPVMEQPTTLNSSVLSEEMPVVEEVVGEEPAILDENKSADDINAPLPELDSLKDVEEDTDENDVWKF